MNKSCCCGQADVRRRRFKNTVRWVIRQGLLALTFSPRRRSKLRMEVKESSPGIEAVVAFFKPGR